MLDYDAVIAALEKQRPLWPPGTAHGYHARTFGFLLDELVRRISGKRLAEYWHNTFADPLGLDLWIGLPEAENARTATIYAPKSGKAPEPAAFYREFFQPGTLARRTFDSPSGLNAVSAMNLPANRAQPIVSFGGIGTAASLAKFYAMLANGGRLEGKQVFTAATIAQMERNIGERPGSNSSDSDCFFGRVHEGFAGQEAANFRPKRARFWSSGGRGKPCFCRSGKRVELRLRNEPDGAIGFAK